MAGQGWNEKAKGLLKAELAKQGLSHDELAKRLNDIGVPATKASVDSKLSRGTFSAAFLLQCMKAIGCKEIRV